MIILLFHPIKTWQWTRWTTIIIFFMNIPAIWAWYQFDEALAHWLIGVNKKYLGWLKRSKIRKLLD